MKTVPASQQAPEVTATIAPGPTPDLPGTPGRQDDDGIEEQRLMFKSAIGAKLAIAVTGLLLLGFVIVHLAGNLQVFMGPEAINAYGLHLRDFGPLLWVARLGLLAILITHLGIAIYLTRRNTDARPQKYAYALDFPRSTTVSRHMFLTGMLILAFAIYHLAHFTFLWLNPEYKELHWKLHDGRVAHDVYNMMVAGFSSPWVVGLYLVAQLFLWMHLSHGITSTFQTFGLINPKNQGLINSVGPAIASLITLGYIAIPLAVLTGAIEHVTQS